MKGQPSLLLMCNLLVFCKSSSLDNIPHKCSVYDWDCQKDLLHTVLQAIAKTGIPEYQIPPTDPFRLQNVSITLLETVQITVESGAVRGIKNCVVNRFETIVKEGHSLLDMTCNLTIKGKYKALGRAQILENILGSSTIYADGVGKVSIQKFHMLFEYNFKLRAQDGEVYVDLQKEDLQYIYDVKHMSFAASGGIFLGETDATTLVLKLMNDQWKAIMQTYGRPVLDTGVEIIFDHVHKFFQYTPTRFYITEPLAEFARRNNIHK